MPNLIDLGVLSCESPIQVANDNAVFEDVSVDGSIHTVCDNDDDDDVEDLDATNQDWRSDEETVSEMIQKTDDVKLLDGDIFGDNISRFTISDSTLKSVESTSTVCSKNNSIPKLAPTFGAVGTRVPDISSDLGEVSGIHRHHSFGERYHSIPIAQDFYTNDAEVGSTKHTNKIFIGNLGLDRLQFSANRFDQFCSNNPNNSTKHDSVVLNDDEVVNNFVLNLYILRIFIPLFLV